MIHHSRKTCLHCSESSDSVLHTPLHWVLCIVLGDVRLGCTMEMHFMKLSTKWSWVNIKITQVWKLPPSAWCVPQLALTPICDFYMAKYFMAIVFNCFYFAIILLTVDRGIFRCDESWMDKLNRWQPITVPLLNSLRLTHSFTNVRDTVGACLDFYTLVILLWP